MRHAIVTSVHSAIYAGHAIVTAVSLSRATVSRNHDNRPVRVNVLCMGSHMIVMSSPYTDYPSVSYQLGDKTSLQPRYLAEGLVRNPDYGQIATKTLLSAAAPPVFSPAVRDVARSVHSAAAPPLRYIRLVLQFRVLLCHFTNEEL